MPSPLKFPSAPVITTERLILRAHSYDDYDAYMAMFQEADFTRFTSGSPLPKEDVWTKMIRHGGHWSFLGHGYWAIEEKSTGQFIGELGFADFKRDVEPSLEGMLEGGWGFISRVHGKGYASEALKAALKWKDEFFPDRKSICMISPENSASIRLAERHGYLPWTETTYKGVKAILLLRE